jgi:hypothetical protein
MSSMGYLIFIRGIFVILFFLYIDKMKEYLSDHKDLVNVIKGKKKK